MKTGTKTKSRNIFISSLMTLMVVCLVLIGVFLFAPIEAHAASAICPVCSTTKVPVRYSKGICAKNGEHYQTPDTDSTNYDVDGDGTPDTVYLIANTGNLLWFAQQVNAGTGREYNAVLTADISLRLGSIREGFTQLPWTPIGTNTSTSYMGIFDGNGKTITNLVHTSTTVDYVGLFGYVNGGTVKDLTIGSSTLKGNDYVGGIAGALTGGATVENCIVIGTITGTNNVGGVAGYVEASTIENCYSKATVSGTTKVGGIAGNVFSTTSVIDNCYYLNTSASVGFNGSASNGSVVATTSAQESSGELAFLLGDAFGQTIDSGSRQTRPYVGGTKVYKALSCEGDGTVVYTNNSSVNANTQTHLWDTAGFCQTNDSHYQPATLTTDAHDVDGDGAMDQVYEISNAGQLYWFAAQVNGGNTAINGILTKNITVNSSATFTEEGTTATNVRAWTPLGTYSSPFTGVFDGNNKTISKLYINDTATEQGFIGYAGIGSVVKNLGLTNSYFKVGSHGGGLVAKAVKATIKDCYINNVYVTGSNYVGGIVGNASESTVIENCWTNQPVRTSSTYTNVGDLVGILRSNSTIRNSYYIGGGSYTGVGQIADSATTTVAKTAEQFASGEVAYLLGSAWGQNIDSGTAQSYPVLGGKAVYRNNEADAYCDAYVYSNTDTDIFPTKHYYDTATGICSHCEHQGEALYEGTVYNTLTEAIEALDGAADDNVITVMKDIDLGATTLTFDGMITELRGNTADIVISGSAAPMIKITGGGELYLKNITVKSTRTALAAMVGDAAIVITNDSELNVYEGAIVDTVGARLAAAVLTEGSTVSLGGGTIRSSGDGIRYVSAIVLGSGAEENTIKLTWGSIEAEDYAVAGYKPSATYTTAVANIHIGAYNANNRPLPTLNAPIHLTTSAEIIVVETIDNGGYVIASTGGHTFAYAANSLVTLQRTWFRTETEGYYVQKNTDGDLWIGTCVHNELSYVKTGTYKVTETCAVCEGVNEVELHAPADLVYSASAKQATVTGSFFHTAPSVITYCCEGGCKNVLNGKTHTATVTIGSYTLTKNFVIEKAPGTAAVTIQGWKPGDTPNAPVPSSATNGANGITYYYKLAGADDSTYTTTVPTAEGQYILKAVFAAGDNYAEVTAYANFAIGKEMPKYTVPTGLSATYGDLLSSVTLPAGWSWKDGTQTVGNAGTNEFVAVFTPADTDTYLSPEVLVQVVVAKADIPDFTLSQTEFTYVEGMTINLNDYLGGGGGEGSVYWVNITQQNGVEFDFDSATGIISNITLADGTFSAGVVMFESANYNVKENYFTITLNKGTQTLSVSGTPSAPTWKQQYQISVSGNKGALSYAVASGNGTVNNQGVITAFGVGQINYKVIAAETDLYEAATRTFTVTFTKAAGNLAPDYELPTGLTVCVGKSTNDITLPTGWSFATTTTFHSVGVPNVTAKFTPSDTTNYDVYTVSLTITVVGHTGGAEANCTTAQTCTVCGETIVAALGHDMSEATCTEASACQRADCDYTEGEPLDHIDLNTDHVCDRNCGENELGEHVDAGKDHACDYGCNVSIGTCADTDKDHDCDYGCTKYFGEHADAGKDHACDYGCTIAIGTCADTDKNHECDYGCNKTFGDHSDGDDNNHLCDYGCGKSADDGCYDIVVNGKCDECGAEMAHTCVDEGKNHACDICGTNMGEHKDTNNDHVCEYGCTTAIGTCADGDKDHDCDYGCSKVFGEHSDADKNHVCNYGCSVAIGTCADTNKDHECDYGCDKSFGEHADVGKDHNCDYGCNVAIGACEDRNLDHECDYGCTKSFGEHKDTNKDHLCEYGCIETIGECKDDNKDHLCDYGCNKTFGDHSDGNDNNHLCDYGCGKSADNGCYDTVVDGKCDECGAEMAHTCVDEGKNHACDICGTNMGEHKDTNNDHVCEYGCTTAIGTCADGDKDHDCDYGCDKSFGEHADVGKDHNCDYGCNVAIGACEDRNLDHECDYGCSKSFGTHSDGDDNNHLCDYGCGQGADDGCYDTVVDGKCDECGADMEHTCTGGTATCQNKATCSICQKAYGEYAEHSFGNTWEYKDATGHAHVCTVKGCNEHDEIKSHTPNIPAATEQSAQYCTACQYQMAAQLNHTHSPATEWTSNATHHWKACGGCDEHLEEAPHSYDPNNACDTTCEVCSAVREVTHDFTSEWEKDASGHWHVCAKNGCSVTDTKQSHESAGAATETDPEVCRICGWQIAPALGHTTHTPEAEWQKNETHHWHECTGCDGQELDKAAHNDGNNDGSCDACSYEMGMPQLHHEHDYGTDWVTDANNHWKECECEEKSEVGTHVDNNGDNKCDTCDYAMPAHDPDNPDDPNNTPDDPNNTPDDPNGDDEGGLGTGAVIAIVAASVVALGGGGFALYWFVIRKKKVI